MLSFDCQRLYFRANTIPEIKTPGANSVLQTVKVELCLTLGKALVFKFRNANVHSSILIDDADLLFADLAKTRQVVELPRKMQAHTTSAADWRSSSASLMDLQEEFDLMIPR